MSSPDLAGAGNWPEDATHENGNYHCRCCDCGKLFIGHKRRVLCKVCAAKTPDLAGAVEAVKALVERIDGERADLHGGIKGAWANIGPQIATRDAIEAARAALPLLERAADEQQAAKDRWAINEQEVDAARAQLVADRKRIEEDSYIDRFQADARVAALRAQLEEARAAAIFRTDTIARCRLCDIGAAFNDPNPAVHRERCVYSGDVRAALSPEEPGT